MASSFNAGRIVQSFVTAFADANGLAPRVMPVVQVPGASAYKVGGAALGGTAATLSATATSLAASDAFSFESSFAMAQKVVKHTIPLNTLQTDYALDAAGQGMADSIMSALDKLGFDGLEGLFAAAHPREGAGAGQVGAANQFYLDASLAFLQGEAGAGSNANLLTTALDESALNNAIKLMIGYKNDRGHPMHLGANGGLVLVVAPKNAQVAHELVRSQLSGADMASNFVTNLISDIVVWPFTTDDDDWFLIHKTKCPVGLAVAEAPTVEINTSDDGLFVHIVGKFTACFFRSPYEYGIVGSNVA